MTEKTIKVIPTTKLHFCIDAESDQSIVFFGCRQIGEIKKEKWGKLVFHQNGKPRKFAAIYFYHQMEVMLQNAVKNGNLDTCPNYTDKERADGIGCDASRLLNQMEIELSDTDRANQRFDPDIHAGTGVIDKIVLFLLDAIDFNNLKRFEETGDFDLLDGMAYDYFYNLNLP